MEGSSRAALWWRGCNISDRRFQLYHIVYSIYLIETVKPRVV
eukprot:SAG25_NODE_86_length_16515_cov_5.529996_12_plen_42_part_00